MHSSSPSKLDSRCCESTFMVPVIFFHRSFRQFGVPGCRLNWALNRIMLVSFRSTVYLKGISVSEDGPVELEIGKICGKRWKIIDKLGEGGCGSVYKVQDIHTMAKVTYHIHSLCKSNLFVRNNKHSFPPRPPPLHPHPSPLPTDMLLSLYVHYAHPRAQTLAIQPQLQNFLSFMSWGTTFDQESRVGEQSGQP